MSIDIEAEAREAAAIVAERRVIRTGLDAWREINRAESFEGWKRIGAALAVGKAHALKVSRARTAWGRTYSREFSLWVRQHHFDKMPAATRSVAVELHEHAEAITAWRNGLPERNGDASFTRYRSQDAGEPLQRTATADAHRTYGATLRQRGSVSARARRHSRRLRRSRYGNPLRPRLQLTLHRGEIFLQASGGVGAKEGDLRSPLVFRFIRLRSPTAAYQALPKAVIVPVTLTGAKCEK